MSNGKYSKRRGVTTKAMSLILAIVLVVGVSVGGTLAWLTAQTTAVENTFTVGNITITLAETFNTDSNDDGTPDKWVGKVVPGGTHPKDPKITVELGSEKCYVYALVTNTCKIGGDVVITPNIDTAKWTPVGTSGDKILYRYADIVDASAADQPLPVFTEVAYSETILESNISSLSSTSITIQGYAHQSDNTDQNTADAAAKAWAKLS